MDPENLTPGSPEWLTDLSKHFTDDTRLGLRAAAAHLTALREDKARLEAVRLAALKNVAIHVNAIPDSHIENGRLEHAFVLAAHRILATGTPEGVLPRTPDAEGQQT